MATHECKDCAALPESQRPKNPRPASPPGPRCATHKRAHRKAQRSRAADTRAARNFNAPKGLYEKVLAFQGGTCAIARCPATGKTKRLAWDHDHACCPGPRSCGKCLRGLLCGPHNYELIGKYGNSLQDGLDYLADPPLARFWGSISDSGG